MSNREDYGWLLDRLRELVLQIEALAQERRPVAVVQTPRGTEYTYSDGTRMLWQVDSDRARAPEWAELLPLPGTRRARHSRAAVEAREESQAAERELVERVREDEITEGVWYPLDADPAELVGVLVDALESVERCTLYGAADQAREKMRHALDRAREWQKGGSDGE